MAIISSGFKYLWGFFVCFVFFKGGVVVVVSVVYLVKYSSITFEFKNVTWNFFHVCCAYMGLIIGEVY